MKTSDVFKVSYGVTLGFMCAKLTVKCGCRILEKLCDLGIDKLEKKQKVNYEPYYTKEEEEEKEGTTDEE